MSSRHIGVVFGIAFAVPACTSLPRINTFSSCNGSTPSHLLVEAVDATGKHLRPRETPRGVDKFCWYGEAAASGGFLPCLGR